VAGRKFDGLDPVGVFNHEFPTIVFMRVGEKEGGGEICADTLTGAPNFADGVIYVGAEGLASDIAIEEWWEDAGRESGGDEKGVAAEGLEDHGLELARSGRVLRKLLIVFHLRGLTAGGNTAIDPLRLIEDAAGGGDLVRG
jgi:hypothetical protein